MRVCALSNAPWAATGYGRQINLLIPHLVADGHELVVAANYGLAGTVLNWQGTTVLPMGADMYSNDIAPAHYVAWSRSKPAWLLTLYDVWPLRPEAFNQIPNIASWVPVDHFPAPREVIGWFRGTGAVPIAMSRYGQRQLELAELSEVFYVPHAVDTEVFRPGQTMAAGTTGREFLGLDEDVFLVVINGANKGNQPPRKAWPEMFRAMGAFMVAHDDVHLYVHSDSTGSQNGVDLRLLASASGIPADRIKFADRYALFLGAITDQDVAALVGAADVMLAPSYGEGFGVPVLESLATGTAAIVNSFSAQPEILGWQAIDRDWLTFEPGPDAVGWLTEGQPWWDAHHDADFKVPYIGSIIEQLEAAYAARGDEMLRARCRKRALEYDVNKVYTEQWRPVLAELESRTRTFDPAPKPTNREARRAAKGRKR